MRAPRVEEVTIFIPVIGEPGPIERCLQSLRQFAPPESRIVVLDGVTDEEAQGHSIQQRCESAGLKQLVYTRSESSFSFASLCNWGWTTLGKPDLDLMIVGTATEVTGGFLEEMLEVLYAHERHAAVLPLSNCAGYLSIPPKSSIKQISSLATNLAEGDSFEACSEPGQAFQVWREIQNELPRFSVVPSIAGSCVLLRGEILHRFGFLEEPEPGAAYNEMDDFACRVNRRGFSTVVANAAFVFSDKPFPTCHPQRHKRRMSLEQVRYPEFEKKISEYQRYDLPPVQRFSRLRLPHKPTILFDLFHLTAERSGTSEFGMNLLREIHTLMADTCDLFVGLSREGRSSFPELNGYRLFHEQTQPERLFDLAFKPNQFFTWAEFRRVIRLSPRLAFVLQDIIALRCDYLASVDRTTIFRESALLADRVYTISEFSRSDFQAFFQLELDMPTIHHGTNFGLSAAERLRGEHVLVMGNRFAHKGVEETLEHLDNAGPVIVIGGELPGRNLPESVQWHVSGNLTQGHMRELLVRARALIYPSFYEGFGLPIVDALALGKPVIAINSEVNREVSYAINNPNLQLVNGFEELPGALERAFAHGLRTTEHIRRWSDVAAEYASSFEDLLKRKPDRTKLEARQRVLRLLDSARHP